MQQSARTLALEPVLVRIPAEKLRRNLLDEFGRRERVGQREDTYEFARELKARVWHLFGCPTPNSLSYLVFYAIELRVSPDELARFIGRQFNLNILRGRE